MINLKKYFQPNPLLLPVTKSEKEALEYLVANKQEFDNWLSHRPQQRVRFQFYFPTAIDLYFDEFHLFTAYFNKTAPGQFQFHQLKMTRVNYTTICSSNWKPFEETILQFLHFLEEKNKISYFQKTSSLQEYMAVCEKAPPAKEQHLSRGINPSVVTG